MEATDDLPDDPEVRRRVDVLTHLRDATIDLGQGAAGARQPGGGP